jgi:hypothetical protein
MIHVVELPIAENALKLTVLPDIAPNIRIAMGVEEIESHNLMASRQHLVDYLRPNETPSPRDQEAIGFHRNFSW